VSGPGTGDRSKSAPGAVQRRGAGQARAVVPVAEPAPTPAEEHLGERLTALVDGELGHDARERVLAHIATCDECRAEVDEQRRLKGVFAAASRMTPAPPPGLMARLQALPGLDQGDDDSGFFGGGRLGGEGLLPGGAGESMLSPGRGSGFRIHDVAKPAERVAAHRGRRFAFAAAGALSMAAVALGGAIPVEEVPSGGLPDEPGTSVTPVSVYSGTTTGLSTEAGTPFLLNAPVSLLSTSETTTLPRDVVPTASTSPSTTPTILAHRLLP
jgi:Putative zinc-finger